MVAQRTKTSKSTQNHTRNSNSKGAESEGHACTQSESAPLHFAHCGSRLQHQVGLDYRYAGEPQHAKVSAHRVGFATIKGGKVKGATYSFGWRTDGNGSNGMKEGQNHHIQEESGGRAEVHAGDARKIVDVSERQTLSRRGGTRARVSHPSPPCFTRPRSVRRTRTKRFRLGDEPGMRVPRWHPLRGS